MEVRRSRLALVRLCTNSRYHSKLLLFFVIVSNNVLLVGDIVLDGMTPNGKHLVSVVNLTPWNNKFAKHLVQPIYTVGGMISILCVVAFT